MKHNEYLTQLNGLLQFTELMKTIRIHQLNNSEDDLTPEELEIMAEMSKILQEELDKEIIKKLVELAKE